MGLLGMEDCTEAVGKKEEPQGRALKYQDHKDLDCSENCNKRATFIIHAEDTVRLSIIELSM